MWVEKTLNCSWANSNNQGSFIHTDYVCCMLWMHEMAMKKTETIKIGDYKVKFKHFISTNRKKYNLFLSNINC